MGVTLSQNAFNRTAAAVIAYEQTGPTPNTDTPTLGPQPGAFIAEIVEQSATNPGRYSWKRKKWQNGNLVDTSPLVQDVRHTLRELNGFSGMTAGTWVIATFVGMDPAANDSAGTGTGGGVDGNGGTGVGSGGSYASEPVYSFSYNLPAGGQRYQGLFKLDDNGSVGWDWARIHSGEVDETITGTGTGTGS